LQVTDSELPALFQASDAAGVRAQKQYARLVALDLTVMILGAVLAAVSFGGPVVRSDMALASAVCIAASFAMTFALKAEGLSRTWYAGRAVAESARTAAWRYMMRAEPYASLADGEADRKLGEALDSYLAERRDLAGSLAPALMAAPQISDTMRKVRALPLAERRDLYSRSRARDQKLWYAAKAATNKARSQLFFQLVLLCQALALVAAIVLVRWPDAPVDLTGVFASLAAALVAWTQLKKHEELANAYGMNAQELSSIEGQLPAANSEEELSRIVVTAENAIARETALWLARREAS
jgi:hypothetical protein